MSMGSIRILAYPTCHKDNILLVFKKYFDFDKLRMIYGQSNTF